ncbi:GNAT family protein [Clostridium sp. UBA7503]|uniref:GNAT family N-acetyltransferase n=1 Tax=Clostridium sp. UBA7503 TaxID=1946377 RepID=UPI0032180DF4
MIRLELIKKEDLNKIVEWNSNKSADELLQWAGPLYEHPLTLSQVEKYFLDEKNKGVVDTYIYKIATISTGDIIGTVELREVDQENKVARVCRFLIGEEKERGKGIGALALKEVLRIGFEVKGFEKITLGVFDFNKGAVRCYEKAGFEIEKLIKDARKAKDGYWSLYEMSVSKSKWIKENN